MELVIERAAAKALRKLRPKARLAMVERFRRIAENPFAKQTNVDALVGEKDAFRLRQGDWRAVYKVDREAGVVRVLRIAQRGKVYR
jgi:mRNA interferase RelE/StbE